MGAGALAVCQSKSAVRLKEDMKKIAATPLNRQKGMACRKVFGVSLQELQQQGLSKCGVPVVVWDMIEYLTQHGLKQEGLFRVNGSLRMVEQLRVKYETGEEVDLTTEGDVSSAASLLKLFLRELPERVITSAAQPKFIQFYQDSKHYGVNANTLKELVKQLPEAHYCLLKYLCQFLRRVSEHHSENKMNISNLATVFGPNCFHVSPGFEGMKEQEICNKIMAQMLEHCRALFEWEYPKKKDIHPCEELAKIILVKEANCNQAGPIILKNMEKEVPKLNPRNKLSKSKQEGSSPAHLVPQPKQSDGIPRVSIHLTDSSCLEEMDLADEVSFISSAAFFSSSQEEERPMSPFYLSAHVSQVNNNIPASGEFLEKTIRSAVEQHLFDVHGSGGQSSEESESGTSSTSSSVSARQRRRHHKEHDEARRNRDMEVINKENIPSGFSSLEECMLTGSEVEKLQENSSGYIGERSKPKRQKSSTKLSELNDNKDSPLTVETFGSLRPVDRTEPADMEIFSEDSKDNESDGIILRHSQAGMVVHFPQLQRLSTPNLEERHRVRPKISLSGYYKNLSMKIQEPSSIPEAKFQRNQDTDGQEECFVSEVPRLDLTSLHSENDWEEPIPAFSSWQRDGLDSNEARLSPQAGRLIRQLLDEDSDPMLSPRFYAYGQSQQYLDDTEVPPSPPNAHSFMRRRSSSLGSCEDSREDLTPVQLTRRIQGLKKKIRKFEDRFEEERKYRPSHSDKAANLEVLKWTNELAKFRKQLKESKLKLSEEDLAPVMRQRSNTLPKSFGSQLEKEEEKKQELSDKSAKPAVETTLESIQKKLQEKRTETNRPEDIKDMTKDQIAAEKLALQKALLYYESIHGRPVTKHERQMMKPLYDRYRLVKQILSRANTIPIISSPSSKRRSPLLQPIIEGETASFFKEIKEEEDGSEEDINAKLEFTVTLKSDFSVRSFLDQLEDDADDFVSPVDDRIPSRGSQDLRVSNLHAASMPELVEQLQEVREEKKRIRKKLRDFEENFFRQNGRNVQKEDRTPMAEEYNEYKQIKAKLRLLEVLISKRDISSKTM